MHVAFTLQVVQRLWQRWSPGRRCMHSGFNTLLRPWAVNIVSILVLAFAFNAFFEWRRYPASLAAKDTGDVVSNRDGYAPVDHANLVYALSQIDSFIDVTEEDLLKIYKLATGRTVTSHAKNDSRL